jgi:hypothetical protein
LKNSICVFLIVVFSACSADILRDVNIVELEYPSDLPVITRADWGWEMFEYIIDEHEIEYITLHHGGVEFSSDKDLPTYLRGLQSWSRSDKNWIDIPYHFIIDLKGNIYEARPINYPGDTNTNYNPKGHALVNVVGNYEHQVINENQLDAVISICAYLSKQFDVDPILIKGHKDYTDGTVCPGKDFYKYLENGIIVGRVKDKIAQ